MRNLTVSLDDEPYRRPRTIAAQRDTSVSALVKGFLVELTSGESKTERLKREERVLRERITDFDASDRVVIRAWVATSATPPLAVDVVE